MRILSLLLMASLLLPLLVAQNSKVDDRIYDEVRRKLANDPDVKGAAFEVEVKDGAVTLRGKVHTEKAREKAEHMTKKIKGVVSVDNKLTLFGTQ
jgi:osmotically-inducible protein OsmY